jgi:hypothetical protein
VSTPERVGVVGQRDFPDLGAVVELVNNLPLGTVVVTGCCRTGADSAARAAAGKRFGIGLKVHRARWLELGLRAGPVRNGELVRDIGRLVAFYVDGSRAPDDADGTMNCVRQARALGIPVEIRGPRPAAPVE